jgi:hypothetical protein
MHAATEVGFRRLDQEVDVIRHEAVREAVPSKGSCNPAKQLEITPPVFVVEEDQSPLDTSSEDVVNAGFGLITR